MHEFIAKHREQIVGTLSGFDRLVFRGTLRSLAYPEAMMRYLWANQILLKDFGSHAQQVSDRLKKAASAEAEALGRPVEYLPSSKASKEDIARAIAARDHIRDGLVCMLSCVEPCWSFEVRRDRQGRRLVLEKRYRKCLFLYRYAIDPEFGFMNARIQTWFPFPVQICLNGREWLRRQMDQQKLEYMARDNCFPWLADWTRAQELMNDQLRIDWPQMLDRVATELNPAHEAIFDRVPAAYYWTTYQSEWAVDVVFRQAADLRELYPRLLHHGMTTFSSSDVIRFLGKRLRQDGQIPRTLSGEVVTSFKEREEGVRLKHYVNGNSLKLYDKAFTTAGSVLRAETTINNVGDLRTYRAKEKDPSRKLAWRKMRAGIADLYRRAEVSRKAAERYLDAYASVEQQTTLEELVHGLEKRTVWRGRPVRPLRPFGDDTALLQAVNRGEFALNGFRNRDLQAIFFPSPASSPKEARRRSAWIGRKLTLLRAHGLITKPHGTHRYQLTSSGRKTISALLAALRTTVRQLLPIAA
jgi:hypothetical protein